MNTDLELIENYLTGQLTQSDRSRFETSLRTDPTVAEALAFYVLAQETAKNEARSQRKAELDALRIRSADLVAARPLLRPSWGVSPVWLAAASVVLMLGLGWYFVGRSTSTGELASADATEFADAYMTEHFDQLTVTMGGLTPKGVEIDSLPIGIQFYNEQRIEEAGALFDRVLHRQPNNDQALKYAGIVALRQGRYASAIDNFHQLSQRTDLFANPGYFLEALAHLKRNVPMDKEQAKKLLDVVVSRNLEGKAEAQQLLDRLN